MASKTLTVVITGDARDAQRAFKDVEGASDSFGSKMSDLGGKLTDFGSKMTIGVTAPLYLLGKQAFGAASDLNESMSKVDAIFEGNAGKITRWADGAAEDFGQSKQSALDAAGAFGNMFLQLGIGIDPATKMSKKMTELASDFASFHNADISEVIEAQSAAFRGEYDALQKFVPTISAATVQTKALEMTGKDNAASLTAQEKATATYALMMEGAGKAVGDFDRTADGAANKQRTLTAKFEDAKAKIGEALVPIFQELSRVLSKVADWFSKLDPKWQKLITYAGIAAVAIGPLATAIGGLVTVVGLLASPITLIVIAVAAVVAAVVLMWLKWDEIWNWMKDHPAILLVVSILAAPVAALFLIVGAVKFLYENWGTIWPQIQAVLETVWGAMQPVFDFLVDAYHAVDDALVWLNDQWAAIWPTIQAILEGAWSVIQTILEVAIPAAFDVVSTVAGVLRGVWEDVWNNGIAPVISGAWAIIEPVLGFLRDRLGDIGSAAGTMKDAAKDAFDTVVSAAGVLWGAIDGPLNALLGVLQGIYNTAKKVVEILPSIPNVSGPGGPSLGDQLENAGYGKRAAGGPVMGGGLYLVGEQGPELFRPSTSGQIIPNHKIAGASTTYQLNGDFVFPNVRTAADADGIFQVLRRMAEAS